MTRGLTVYLSGPMTGKTLSEAMSWRQHAADMLEEAGFKVLDPLRGLQYKYGPNDTLGNTADEQELGIMSHSWFMRDKFDTLQADIVLVNFCGADKVSIGTAMEIAWAFLASKFVVVALPPSDIERHNPHNHLFIKECACKLVESPLDGVDYIIATFGS